jgi:uncharacterized protein
MNELFAARSRGFWDQARPLTLDPLSRDDVADYIERRFTEAHMDVGEALGSLLDVARGHPQRTMLLAHMLWERTPPGEEADAETWVQALRAAQLDEEPAMEALWRGIPTGQQRALRAVALFNGRPHRLEAAAAVGMAPGSVGGAVDALVNHYVLRPVGEGRYAFVDPLFELWARDLALEQLPSRPPLDDD